jgi:hypothetical protein
MNQNINKRRTKIKNMEMEIIDLMITKNHIIKEDIKMIKLILKRNNNQNSLGINLILLVKGLPTRIIRIITKRQNSPKIRRFWNI